jgi:hypothetical protein
MYVMDNLNNRLYFDSGKKKIYYVKDAKITILDGFNASNLVQFIQAV